MAERHRRPTGGTSGQDNPLNSYRMSMLAHGFTQDADGSKGRWRPTLNPWLRPDGTAPMSRVALVVVTVGLVVAIVAALAAIVG